MKIGIYGYGNLGKGVEISAKYNKDVTITGIFTRRNPETVTPVFPETPVYSASDIEKFKDDIDVLVICGGSATDLPVITPMLASQFNVIDSFDTHATINEHFDKVNEASISSGHTSLISAGWDPGLFSLARIYANAALPSGSDYTFWGKGISQGHSDAIRRIEGVLDARQYTIPKETALSAVKNGESPSLSASDKHIRDCYVVVKDGFDKDKIEKAIKEMPNYFADYETQVTFITKDELIKNHSGMPHGGSVIRNGKTGKVGENISTFEFSLKLDSNPEFTASVLIAYARAVYKMHLRNEIGCKTVFDVRPSDLLAMRDSEIRHKFL